MKVSELSVALSTLDPDLPVVAEMVDTGEMIPIDVVLSVGVARSNVPDSEYAVLRPLEDWVIGAES